MPVYLIEGFDDLTTASLRAAYSGSSTTYELVPGRFGGQAVRRQGFAVATFRFPGPVITSYGDTVTVGCALFFPALATMTTGSFIYLVPVEDTGGHIRVSLNFTTGEVYIERNSAFSVFTEIARSEEGNLFSKNKWFYLEVGAVISKTDGAVRVAVDGDTVIDVSGINTHSYVSGTTARIGSVEIRGVTGNENVETFDDVFLSDELLLLGPQKIEVIRPDGDDAVSWSPDSGTANFSRVNEVFTDGDASYVETGGTGSVDRYTLGSLPTVPDSISAVAVRTFARKTDVSALAIADGLRIGSVDYWLPSKNLLTDYSLFSTVLPVNPATSAPWEPLDIDGLKYQVKAE